jgi:hypothetical protein
MYEKLLKFIEEQLENRIIVEYDEINKKLEAIIKIKTIQAMDISKELIEESRKVLKR